MIGFDQQQSCIENNSVEKGCFHGQLHVHPNLTILKHKLHNALHIKRTDSLNIHVCWNVPENSVEMETHTGQNADNKR